jgi:hypothetical protein
MNAFTDENENYENTSHDEEEDPYVNIRADLTPNTGIQILLSSDVANKGNVIDAYEKTKDEIESKVVEYLTDKYVGKYLIFRDDDGSRQTDEYIAFKIIMESTPEDKIYHVLVDSGAIKMRPVVTKGTNTFSLSPPVLVFLVEDPDPDSDINERNARLKDRREKNKTKRALRLYTPYGGTKKKYNTIRVIKHKNIIKSTYKHRKQNISKKSKKNKRSKSKKI